MNRPLLILAVLWLVVGLVILFTQNDEPAPVAANVATTTTTTEVPPPVTVATPAEPVAAQDERPNPVVPPEAAAPPPVAKLIPEAQLDVAGVVRQGFARFGPAVAEEAVRVAGCESTWRPWVTNEGSVGVMQIHVPSHRARIARLGFTPDQMTDPVANVAVAVDIYGEQGWGPWECRWAA